MTVEELKREAAALDQQKQDQLFAYLFHLRNSRDPQYRREITESRDDKNPANWVSLDEFERQTGLK